MKTFCGDITKQDLLTEIKKHQDADQIAQGTYGEGEGEDWRGCAVGCSIRSINHLRGKAYRTGDHSVYESELGIPEWLARLEDRIFEGLPKSKAMLWPMRFTSAVPEGVDLERVKWQFCAYLMERNISRVLGLDIDDSLKERVVSAIRDVLVLHEAAAATGEWDESAARSAELVAWSAESAAESAAWSAESAAWSVARSAESAARSAARSAESAARSAEYEQYADNLVELLEAVGDE